MSPSAGSPAGPAGSPAGTAGKASETARRANPGRSESDLAGSEEQAAGESGDAVGSTVTQAGAALSGSTGEGDKGDSTPGDEDKTDSAGSVTIRMSGLAEPDAGIGPLFTRTDTGSLLYCVHWDEAAPTSEGVASYHEVKDREITAELRAALFAGYPTLGVEFDVPLSDELLQYNTQLALWSLPSPEARQDLYGFGREVYTFATTPSTRDAIDGIPVIEGAYSADDLVLEKDSSGVWSSGYLKVGGDYSGSLRVKKSDEYEVTDIYGTPVTFLQPGSQFLIRRTAEGDPDSAVTVPQLFSYRHLGGIRFYDTDEQGTKNDHPVKYQLMVESDSTEENLGVTLTVKGEPEEPDQPDTPDEPEKPDTPDEPDEPEKPDTPDTPDTPDEPDEPDEPKTPDKPSTPETPDTPTPDRPETPTPTPTPVTPPTPTMPTVPVTPVTPKTPEVPKTQVKKEEKKTPVKPTTEEKTQKVSTKTQKAGTSPKTADLSPEAWVLLAMAGISAAALISLLRSAWLRHRR